MPFTLSVCYFLGLALALLYLALILRLVAVWRRMPAFSPEESFRPRTFISVVIPARNESATIETCLQALAGQDYPRELYEVWVVDDHSTDPTAKRVEQFPMSNLHLLRLAEHIDLDAGFGYKKQAIAWAIEHARGELIVTTDADCMAPPGWLRHLAAGYQQGETRFIAAPVVFSSSASLLGDFQILDFLGMMLLTGAGIETGWFYLSNGANLAYPKTVFQEVAGFAGVQDIASGDDLLLLHKIILHNPHGIRFLKALPATVSTSVQPTLGAFLLQRLRWASKSRRYTDRRVTAVLALIFFLCWSILLSLPAALWFGWMPLAGGVVLFLIKTVADYHLLSAAAQFFDRRPLLRRFWPAQFLHILYIALIGLLANVRKEYEWKGRQVR